MLQRGLSTVRSNEWSRRVKGKEEGKEDFLIKEISMLNLSWNGRRGRERRRRRVYEVHTVKTRKQKIRKRGIYSLHQTR